MEVIGISSTGSSDGDGIGWCGVVWCKVVVVVVVVEELHLRVVPLVLSSSQGQHDSSVEGGRLLMSTSDEPLFLKICRDY